MGKRNTKKVYQSWSVNPLPHSLLIVQLFPAKTASTQSCPSQNCVSGQSDEESHWAPVGVIQ